MGKHSLTQILLVDDDSIVLNTLGQGLSRLNYVVDQCADGAAALRNYAQQPPDLVVMDFGMPGMNGTEVASAMLKLAYRPIIMLSAHNNLAIVKEAIGRGVAAYMVKPVEAEQLAPSIEAALARFAEVNALMKHGANIQQAMEKNRIINAAVGIIMERAGLPNDIAFERLRALARQQRCHLRDLAFELVDAISTANSVLHRLRK